MFIGKQKYPTMKKIKCAMLDIQSEITKKQVNMTQNEEKK